MTHDILATVFSNHVEWLVFLLGCVAGLVLAWLWRFHRDAALFVLGFLVAMTLGRNTWNPAGAYQVAVHYRPLAMKPWYFLSGMALVALLAVPLTRLVGFRLRDDLPPGEDRIK